MSLVSKQACLCGQSRPRSLWGRKNGSVFVMKKSRVLKPLILLFLLGCTSTTTGMKDGGVQQDQVESDGAISVERFSLLTYNVCTL